MVEVRSLGRIALSAVYRQFTLIGDPDGVHDKALASADDAEGNNGGRATCLIDPPTSHGALT